MIAALVAFVIALFVCFVGFVVSSESIEKSGGAEKLPKDYDYNPQLVIKTHNGFKVIRDDLLISGTKQRAAVDLFRILDADEIIYVSPTTGYAQIALSLAAQITGKKSVIFLAKERPMRPQTKKAIELGGIIKEGPRHSKMRDLRTTAEKYIAEDPQHRQELYFGLDEGPFKELLEKNIKVACEGTELSDFEKARTFWIVGGSAVLAKVLSEIFPNSFFNVVQVGKKLPELNDRFKIWIAPENFYEDARQKPPYPSVATYDAKVWQFAKKHGKPGDFIWNVAG